MKRKTKKEWFIIRIIRENKIQLIISVLLLVAFSFGAEVTNTLILSIVYQLYFVNFVFEPKAEEKKEELENFEKIYNEKGYKFDKIHFDKSCNFTRKSLDLMVFAVLNVPLAIYGIIENYEKLSVLINDKVVFSIICAFIVFLICLKLITSSPEYKRISKIDECKRNDENIKILESELDNFNVFITYEKLSENN